PSRASADLAHLFRDDRQRGRSRGGFAIVRQQREENKSAAERANAGGRVPPLILRQRLHIREFLIREKAVRLETAGRVDDGERQLLFDGAREQIGERVAHQS